MSARLIRSGLAIALVLSCAGLIFGLKHAIAHGAVAVLVDDPSAHWIVSPTPLNPAPRPAVDLPATFRRTFTIAPTVPRKATLNLRTFGSGTIVTINGQVTSGAENVSHLLKLGENELAIEVSNLHGPPAIRAALDCVEPSMTIASDESWDASWSGAAWARAVRASSTDRPDMLSSFRNRYRPVESFQHSWRGLATIAGAIAVGVAGWALWVKRRSGAVDLQQFWRLASYVLVAVVGLGWIFMRFHNGPWLRAEAGYDAVGHLQYIDYVQKNAALPLADQGWSMHHPPLYYILMAGVLQVCGLSVRDAAGIGMIRSVNLLLGLTTLGLLLATLRLLFPQQPRRWFAGLLIGAFLPANLYLHQYPTNEVLAATLATASLFLAIRILRASDFRIRDYALLGASMGAAMLTKTSALPVLAIIPVVLIWRPGHRRAVALSVALCVLVCGWHYVRVWNHFGKPFVANWDPTGGLQWWQDPGYRTIGDYLRFGDALRRPLMNLDAGVWDGYYETMWGDAFLGGAGAPEFRPPWAFDLMAGGYVLAVVPTVAIIVGFISVAWRSARRQTRAPETTLLLGAMLAMGLAMIWVTLRVPAFSVVKAFFGLPALAAICAMGAIGIDVLSARRRWIQTMIMLATGIWALNAFRTYWINPDRDDTRLLVAHEMLSSGNLKDGRPMLNSALALAPDEPAVRVAAAQLAIHDGDLHKARELLELPPGSNISDSAGRHALLSFLASHDANSVQAMLELDRAIALDPQDAGLHVQRATLLEARGDVSGAVAAWREALRVDPFDPTVHTRLAALYARSGQAALATQHQLYAQRLTKR